MPAGALALYSSGVGGMAARYTGVLERVVYVAWWIIYCTNVDILLDFRVVVYIRLCCNIINIWGRGIFVPFQFLEER